MSPLHALADLGPILEAPDAEFGHWVTPPPKGGVHSMAWNEFGPAGEASALRRPDAVAGTTRDDLAKLLAAIIRSDRLVEGSLEGAFESGLLAAICRRAAVLLETGA